MIEEKEDFKSPAQLEQEARERIRAEIEKDVPNDKPAVGQPVVVKHNKKKSKRTLYVCIFSLLALIGLAMAGDWISGYVKDLRNADDATKEAAEEKSDPNERRDIGKDNDALSFMTRQADKDNTDQTEKEKESAPDKVKEPSTPPPPVFNKASALAVTEANNSAGRGSSAGKAPSTDSVPVSKVKPEVESGNNVVSVTGVTRLNLDSNLYIPVDRYIPCSMQRKFVSDIAGNISCQISQDVYSANNHVKLIPAGTVARGVYRSGTLKHGQGRMFIAWTELRTPDTLIIPLVDTQAVGQLGENGVAGWIDSHFWERFGNAMMLSVVDDVMAAVADNVPSTDSDTDYTENSREAMADLAKTALENSINIPPTMYLNQGDVIGIMTGADIDFSGVYRLRLKQ
ncbi:VirB10/TraB/TrbI family type IV secretion system protein [Salmonella enterica subsp. enterica]|nr:TrbI/VirB10 family protein [Salmonella enterica subsp. enterica serovar Glostrup]EDW4632804.1 TrbI/VirB10 family protein [Salmonella enterica subsp. enterica]EDZ8322530.1 TrbI/VirB10 family protein [Salmonella enterica]EEE8158204.1 TrbI/VirB10 family protein [Salmonella enterica subsp. enterica serovar Badagry]EIN7308256.1 TrbI/VirB10 family protein [Salmonella enterica subsp. enterica serovar Telelkebir]